MNTFTSPIPPVKAFQTCPPALVLTSPAAFFAPGAAADTNSAVSTPMALAPSTVLIAVVATPCLLRPHVRSDFEDSTLVKAFGQDGREILPAHTIMILRYGKNGRHVAGNVDTVVEHFYAISVSRKKYAILLKRGYTKRQDKIS